MPSPVKDNNSFPYYPVVNLFIDPQQDFILKTELSHPKEYKDNFIDNFFKLLESIKIIPEVIIFQNEEVGLLLERICKKLNIKLSFQNYIEPLEAIKQSLFYRLM